MAATIRHPEASTPLQSAIEGLVRDYPMRCLANNNTPETCSAFQQVLIQQLLRYSDGESVLGAFRVGAQYDRRNSALSPTRGFVASVTAITSRAEAGARGAYFSFDGKSKRRSFLASPMEFSRVTSGFAMRMHPILNVQRRHLGVDYAAPIGTPVRSVGDGVVDFAGRQNGYGNVVEIKHGKERSTLYAHLSSIDVRQGQRVEQGQRVGAVGVQLHLERRGGGVDEHPLDPRVLAAAHPFTQPGG